MLKIRPKNQGAESGGIRGMPLFVLGVALLMSGVATFFVAKTEVQQRQAEFDATVQQIEENIRSRMDSYVALLLGGAGLWAASEHVSAPEFAAFVNRVRLPEKFQGVQGVGFSARFSSNELFQVERQMRSEGVTEFKVWPFDPPRAEYHAILYLDPPDRRNAAAIGFDMFTEHTRRAAMEKARDSGEPAASGRVRLVQEILGPVQNGFLIYVPIYRGGEVPDTVEKRREALEGFVYSPFRVGDLLDGIVGHGIRSRVILRIYDDHVAEENHLHTMNTVGPGEELPFLHGAFRDTHAMRIAGRTWVLQWQSAPMFLGGAFGFGAALIFVTGLVLSGFLFQAVEREGKARAFAEETTMALREEQEMLRLSEERFRLFLERAQEYAIMLLDTEGRISSWNPGAERLFGYTDSEILGKSGSIIFTPEDIAAKAPEKELATAREHGQALDERWHVRKDGSRFFASGTLISLRMENAHHHGYVKILRDMTARKESEEAIRKLNLQLEERVRARTAAVAELNAQMETFTYTIVHDLRAPLRAMHGFSTALMDDYGPQLDSTARDFLQRITGAAERMDALIHDLLDFSLITRADIKFSPVSLETVARAALTSLKEQIVEKQAHVQIIEPLPEVIGEFKILERVLYNFLSNCLKFARPGVPPEISVFAELHGDRVRLSVRDNGIGIHTEHQQRVFRIFEQLHGYNAYPGTGMGLAVVKKSIERLGGTVGVESEVGVGSTFWFELPRPAPRLSAPEQNLP